MKTLKSTLLLTLLFSVLFIAQGCMFNDVNSIKGEGSIIVKEHEIGNFNTIELGGAFEVMLKEGAETKLTIETDENLHQYINIETKNNELHVYSDRDKALRPSKLKVHITYTDLKKLSIGGACSLNSETTIYSDTFEFNISGAGSGKLDIETEKLTTDVSGAASITLTGIAASHNVSLSGASNLKAENLHTKNTVIRLSGAGAAKVFASEVIDANLSGVGSIKYGGNPEIKKTNVSGIGRISSID